jgi:putative DNA primase/helicase
LWGDAVEGSARELLAQADAVDEADGGGTLADAKRFLTSLLADGPVPTKAIRADADGGGYSWATIRRAQSALGVVATKAGMKEGWRWSLPEDAQKNAKTLNQNGWASSVDDEHLRRSRPFETDIVEGEL